MPLPSPSPHLPNCKRRNVYAVTVSPYSLIHGGEDKSGYGFRITLYRYAQANAGFLREQIALDAAIRRHCSGRHFVDTALSSMAPCKRKNVCAITVSPYSLIHGDEDKSGYGFRITPVSTKTAGFSSRADSLGCGDKATLLSLLAALRRPVIEGIY
jgi:hypothetical protein